jgi:head-tail adaptor
VKNISAGDLRHRITVSRVSGRTTDAVGQVVPSYAVLGSYYALVECLGGAETTNAAQLKGTLKYKITLRAGSGPIRPTDKILWNGHTLQVAEASTDPFGILIEVDATEYVVQ